MSRTQQKGGILCLNESKKSIEVLPTVPLRGTVAFPHMIMHFDVAREMSRKPCGGAVHADRRLFLVAQRDVFDENPEERDLFEIGVVAEIKQTLKTQDDTVRILVEGLVPRQHPSGNENGMSAHGGAPTCLHPREDPMMWNAGADAGCQGRV